MMFGQDKGHAGRIPWTVLAGSFVSSAMLLGAAQEASAGGTAVDFARYCARALPGSTVERRAAASGTVVFCRQSGDGDEPVLERVTAGDACLALTGDDAVHRHGSIVHCTRDIRDGRYLLGRWTITPYNIVNWQECGPVRYSAQLEVRERLTAAHYTGVTQFVWDTSRMVPGCTFPANKRGSVPTELFVDGDQITIKYRASGGNNYADDHLVLRGDVMAGTDAAGQRVVYTKIPPDAPPPSLTSTAPETK